MGKTLRKKETMHSVLCRQKLEIIYSLNGSLCISQDISILSVLCKK